MRLNSLTADETVGREQLVNSNQNLALGLPKEYFWAIALFFSDCGLTGFMFVLPLPPRCWGQQSRCPRLEESAFDSSVRFGSRWMGFTHE
jgi:hypothetical protein